MWRVDAANAWAKMRVGYSLTGRQCGKLKNDEFLFNKSNKVPCNYAINNEDFTTQLTIAATNLSDKSMKQRRLRTTLLFYDGPTKSTRSE